MQEKNTYRNKVGNRTMQIGDRCVLWGQNTLLDQQLGNHITKTEEKRKGRSAFHWSLMTLLDRTWQGSLIEAGSWCLKVGLYCYISFHQISQPSVNVKCLVPDSGVTVLKLSVAFIIIFNMTVE